MVAGGATQLFAGEFHPSSGWTTSTLTDATDFAPAVTLTSTTTGIGLIGSTMNGGELHYLTWSPGTWAAPVAIASGVTTRATPSIAAYAGAVSAVFQGTDFKHYYAGYFTSWSPTAEPVGGAANQDFGPSPATITAIGAGSVVAFAGSDGDLYDQTRSGGSWGAADSHNLGDSVSITPTIVALASGPDLMIVFTEMSDSTIFYTTRTAGVWSAPAVTNTNALTNAAVSVAALPNGGAVMAYQGQDSKVYWSLYDPAATPPWSQPAALATPNFATPGTPSVAPGVGGMDAEMVFVDGATGQAKHARLSGTTWSAPVVIGGGGVMLTNAAAASATE